MTTDEMDSTTPDERAALVGQCAKCGNWTKYDRRTQSAVCEIDGEKLIISSIHSQRTFNPKAKKLTKAQMKKMGIRA